MPAGVASDEGTASAESATAGSRSAIISRELDLRLGFGTPEGLASEAGVGDGVARRDGGASTTR